MKKSHIFLIAIIAVAIGVITSTAGDASSYVSFKEANQLAVAGKEAQVHVVGKLKKDGAGQIMGIEYQPELDPNYFSFVLIDNNNEERKVVYYKGKPQDFEKSEQIVVVGNIQEGQFQASSILMKCPSKYQDDQINAEEKPRQAKL